jgi:uncharacterized protein
MDIKLKGKVFLKNVKLCNTSYSRMRGLMFSFEKSALLAMKKEQNLSIHMLFVFYPLDVFWLDKDKKIIDKKKVYPFTMYHAPKEKAQYVLEVPSSQNIGLKEGQVLSF